MASTITRAEPPTARLPRCTKCQWFGSPSSLEYWHIGETKMRFLNSIPLKRKLEKSLLTRFILILLADESSGSNCNLPPE